MRPTTATIVKILQLQLKMTEPDLEGRPARHHLEAQHAQRPPVHRAVVALAAQHLGRDVVIGRTLAKSA